jgi:hypothetical protein
MHNRQPKRDRPIHLFVMSQMPQAVCLVPYKSMIFERIASIFGRMYPLEMNRRRIALIVLFCLTLSGSIASAAYVHSTVVYYRHNAPCTKLTGIPGMLLAAHFFDSAQCKLSNTSPHAPCQDEAECNVIGTTGKKNGKCTPLGQQCVCVLKTL